MPGPGRRPERIFSTISHQFPSSFNRYPGFRRDHVHDPKTQTNIRGTLNGVYQPGDVLFKKCGVGFIRLAFKREASFLKSLLILKAMTSSPQVCSSPGSSYPPPPEMVTEGQLLKDLPDED